MKSRLLALIPIAALVACAHRPPPPPPPPPLDVMGRGRMMVQMFYGPDVNPFYSQLSVQQRMASSPAQVRAINIGVLQQIGGERQLVGERLINANGFPAYDRIFIPVNPGAPMDFIVVFDPTGAVMSYVVHPHVGP